MLYEAGPVVPEDVPLPVDEVFVPTSTTGWFDWLASK
jgi:hypothetical protein